MHHSDHLSGDKAVWRRMPMPGGRSRHQLIPLPRHFHLSGLTACITHPQGRCVCVCVCVFACVCVLLWRQVWAGERAKDRRDEGNYVRGRQTDKDFERNFAGRTGEFSNNVKSA